MNKTVEKIFDERIKSIRQIVIWMWNNRKELIDLQKESGHSILKDYKKYKMLKSLSEPMVDSINGFLYDVIDFDDGKMSKVELINTFIKEL